MPDPVSKTNPTGIPAKLHVETDVELLHEAQSLIWSNEHDLGSKFELFDKRASNLQRLLDSGERYNRGAVTRLISDVDDFLAYVRNNLEVAAKTAGEASQEVAVSSEPPAPLPEMIQDDDTSSVDEAVLQEMFQIMWNNEEAFGEHYELLERRALNIQGLMERGERYSSDAVFNLAADIAKHIGDDLVDAVLVKAGAYGREVEDVEEMTDADILFNLMLLIFNHEDEFGAEYERLHGWAHRLEKRTEEKLDTTDGILKLAVELTKHLSQQQVDKAMGINVGVEDNRMTGMAYASTQNVVSQMLRSGGMVSTHRSLVPSVQKFMLRR